MRRPTTSPVEEHTYPNKRKNNPTAGMAALGKVKPVPQQQYAYDPHLPPILRFDPNGDERLLNLIEKSTTEKLTEDEAKLLMAALQQRYVPGLEWAGKREQPGFAVDPVALHIHERLSARAIISTAARQDVQRSLFAEPNLPYQHAVRFYEHDVAWSNRLVLGDSLQVMASLAHRENLPGRCR